MKRFIVVSFLFLGWAYYELSGGASFEPERRGDAPEMVTRAETPAPAVDVASVLPASAPAAPAAPAEAEAGVDAAVELALAEPALPPGSDADPPQFTFETAAAALAAQTGTESPPGAREPAADLREIVASRVNMREGPGTDYAVIDTLDQGTEMEVLEADQTGWVRVRATASGLEGWMAERLLAPVRG